MSEREQLQQIGRRLSEPMKNAQHELESALGDALARRDRQLSAPARFAFEQAIRLSPRDPGPRFFLGPSALQCNRVCGEIRHRYSPPA